MRTRADCDRAASFLLDTFFKTLQTEDSEEIHFDVDGALVHRRHWPVDEQEAVYSGFEVAQPHLEDLIEQAEKMVMTIRAENSEVIRPALPKDDSFENTDDDLRRLFVGFHLAQAMHNWAQTALRPNRVSSPATISLSSAAHVSSASTASSSSASGSSQSGCAGPSTTRSISVSDNSLSRPRTT